MEMSNGELFWEDFYMQNIFRIGTPQDIDSKLCLLSNVD